MNVNTGIFTLAVFTCVQSGTDKKIPQIQPFVFPDNMMSGNKASLICALLAGHTPINFKWLKDGRDIDSNYAKTQQLDEASILTIAHISGDNSGNYTCVAKNDLGEDHHTAVLKVKVPARWLSVPNDQNILVGSTSEVACHAEGSPVPRISWHKEVPAKFEEKFYVQTVGRGESAALQCDARGDLPLQVIWAKDKRPVDTTDSKRYEKFETTSHDGVMAELVVRNVERADGALYTCTAKNEFGTDERNIKLVVIEVPAQPLDIRTLEVWSRSSTVTWSAPFTGNSPITNYIIQYWRNKEGPHRLMEEALPATQSLATLKDLHPGTSYAVTVTAQNEVGLGDPSNSVYFTTGEEEPSGPPTDVSAEPKGANSVLVKWKPPPREHWNGQVKGYYIGYKTERASQYSYKSAERPANEIYQYLLTGLLRSTTYVINVKAFNSAGSGPPSHEIRVRTLEGELPKSPAMTLVSSSPSSISVRWVPATRKENITGYTIHYKKDQSHWHLLPVTTPELSSYMLTSLESGMVYKVYLTANNKFGPSEPSELLSVRTEASGVTQALPFYLDLAIVIPVAAIFVAVFVVVIVLIIYMKKSSDRRGLEKALQTGKPYTYVSSSSQRYIDLDIKQARPLSYPDPGTPAASVASYATIPPRDEMMDEVDARAQEMKSFANQSPKDRPSCLPPPRPTSLKRSPPQQQHESTH